MHQESCRHVADWSRNMTWHDVAWHASNNTASGRFLPVTCCCRRTNFISVAKCDYNWQASVICSAHASHCQLANWRTSMLTLLGFAHPDLNCCERLKLWCSSVVSLTLNTGPSYSRIYRVKLVLEADDVDVFDRQMAHIHHHFLTLWTNFLLPGGLFPGVSPPNIRHAVAQWLALATRDRKVASSIPGRGIPRNNLG